MTGVRYEVSAGVATLTLDEADNKNAMTPTLLDGLGDGIARAVADDAVRVVVVTNEGNTFCAGADLKGAGVSPKHNIAGVLTAIQDAPKPVVGKIAGHCMGGGVGLAAAFDVSVVADDVKIGFTEVRLGVIPAIISVVCLPKLALGVSKELMLSGRRFTGAYAAQVGLVNRAVPAAELAATVDELVGELVQGAPGALAAVKAMIVRVPTLERDAAYAELSKQSAELFAGPEAAEGIAAFRERRPASWVPAV